MVSALWWKGDSHVGLEKHFISNLACVCIGESAGISRSSGSAKLTEMGRKNKRPSRDQLDLVWQKISRQRLRDQSHQDLSATSLGATADGASSAQSGSNLYENLFGIFQVNPFFVP